MTWKDLRDDIQDLFAEYQDDMEFAQVDVLLHKQATESLRSTEYSREYRHLKLLSSSAEQRAQSKHLRSLADHRKASAGDKRPLSYEQAKHKRIKRLAAQRRYNAKRPEPTEELRARRNENKKAWSARQALRVAERTADGNVVDGAGEIGGETHAGQTTS